MESLACAACSSARNTSSLLARPTCEARLGGLQQRLGALEALPRHVEELALGDDVVEGGRHLDREPLLREGERALLALHARAGRS